MSNRKVLVSHLALEPLERREVPATLTWNGTGWNGGTLTQYSDLVFDGNVSNTNCTLPTTLPACSSITTQNGYNKTIFIQSSTGGFLVSRDVTMPTGILDISYNGGGIVMMKWANNVFGSGGATPSTAYLEGGTSGLGIFED